MSQMIDFTLPSSAPGRMLHAFRCVPEGEVRAIVQLSHGMVEFIDRYKPLAEYLAARGILVTGNDRLDETALPRRAVFPAGPQHGLVLCTAVSVRVGQ